MSDITTAGLPFSSDGPEPPPSPDAGRYSYRLGYRNSRCDHCKRTRAAHCSHCRACPNFDHRPHCDHAPGIHRKAT